MKHSHTQGPSDILFHPHPIILLFSLELKTNDLEFQLGSKLAIFKYALEEVLTI